jgi:hypothetical protein
MGAWGVEAFENDQALDWVWMLEKVNDNSLLIKALDTVNNLPAGEYMDGDYGREATAAAEIVAALKGSPLKVLPANVKTWLANNPNVNNPDLTPQCLSAIDRILTEGELVELWADSNHNKEWHAYMADLKSRLKT